MCAVGALAAALLGCRNYALGLGATAVGLRLWRTPGRSLRDAVVVIAGGSRGLGLALADRALRAGARVALLARDLDELHRAQDQLGPRAVGRTMLARCDVTDETELDDAITAVLRTWDRIDIWINNAGAITVGPFASFTREQFDAILELTVHAIVRSTQALLPVFRRQRRGHLVNICSLGGKIGVPHMAAYNTGKFALAGLAQTLAAELAREHIDVTTVYPAVMRVGSTVQARFTGNAQKEYAWFATTSTLPGISVSAEDAAARIFEAVRRRDTELVFPAFARLAVTGQALFPELSALVRGLVARCLPRSDSPETHSGAASRPWLESRWWFLPLRALARSARSRWNEREAVAGNSGRA